MIIVSNVNFNLYLTGGNNFGSIAGNVESMFVSERSFDFLRFTNSDFVRDGLRLPEKIASLIFIQKV